MRKISTKSFDEQSEVRTSKEFNKLSESCIRITDKLQKMEIEHISLVALMKYKNLLLADLLGYAQESDFTDFYKELVDAEFVEDYLVAYKDSAECHADDNIVIISILSSLAEYKEEQK